MTVSTLILVVMGRPTANDCCLPTLFALEATTMTEVQVIEVIDLLEDSEEGEGPPTPVINSFPVATGPSDCVRLTKHTPSLLMPILVHFPALPGFTMDFGTPRDT